MKNQIVCVCEENQQIICSGRKWKKDEMAATKGCHMGRNQSKREIMLLNITLYDADFVKIAF